MAWIQVWPRMELKEEGLFIMVKGMSAMTDLTETSNTTSPSKVVWVPLKPIKIIIYVLTMSNCKIIASKCFMKSLINSNRPILT